MKMNKSDAYKQAIGIVLAAPIPGMRPDVRQWLEQLAEKEGDLAFEDYFRVKFVSWEWAFGVSADIRLEPEAPARDVVIQVSWSSGGGDPVKAMATCTLHRQVCELACHLQTFFRDTDYGEES